MRLGKTEKKRTPDGSLSLQRRMIALDQALFIDKQRCCGCLDCKKVCPAEAISATDPVVVDGTVLKPVAVDVDADTCTFCGECAVICPTKAISWREDGNTVPNVITGGILPSLDEEIKVKVEGCRIECKVACETACPVQAIEVKIECAGGKERIVDVHADRDRCFYCNKCELACPYGLISVRSARSGLVSFSPEYCPPQCQACTNVCPTGAMSLEAGRVELNEDVCIYCRACTVVCPRDEALEVKRERIQGLPLRSQLWAEMQGVLVSPEARIYLIQENASRKRERAFRTRID